MKRTLSDVTQVRDLLKTITYDAMTLSGNVILLPYVVR